MHIIFIYQGRAEFLYYILKQAKALNPTAAIHLISDENNKMLKCVANYNYCQDYYKGAAEFKKYYKHYCTNTIHFELSAFQKHFILRDFVVAHGIKKFFSPDADVMIYCDIEKEAKKFQDFDLTLSSIPQGLAGSPSCSFWNNSESLQRFCQFVMDMYTGKDRDNYNKMVNHYNNLQSRGLPGGVCDMTALWLFKLNNYARIAETQEIIEGSTYDHNINASLNGKVRFEMDGMIKKIDWQEGRPYGTILGTKERIRFNVLHFQGLAKQYIEPFYRKNNPGCSLKKSLEEARCLYIPRLKDRLYSILKKP